MSTSQEPTNKTFFRDNNNNSAAGGVDAAGNAVTPLIADDNGAW